MKLSDRMIQRLRDMGFSLSEEATIVRTYAGHWQKSSGAWAWVVQDPGGAWSECLGGQDTLTNLIKCPNLNTWSDGYDTHVECDCGGHHE